MFDIKPRSNMSVTEQLLFNIWQELKELNSKKENNEVIDKAVEKKESKFKCKTCGTEHENKGSLLMCYKKHKEKGA
jgi:hypothetical protein